MVHPEDKAEQARLNAEAEDDFDQLMDDMQVLITMRAGQTVTQDDVDALNRLDKHYRDNEESATDAFHEGRQQGLLEAGGADLVAIKNKYDEQFTELAARRALGRFDEQRGFRRGAQACREMMARFVEQAGGPTRGIHAIIAQSIRANWSPSWGEDPGRPEVIPCSPEAGGWLGPDLDEKAKRLIAENKPAAS